MKTNKQNISNLKANKKTREALKKALIELMDIKDFKSITITELTSKSNVSRVAFYRNYHSKEDILLEVSQDTVNDIYNILLKNKKSSFIFYKKCFDLLKKYYKIAKLIIVDACIPLQELYSHLKISKSKKDFSYKELSFESAFNSIIFRWLNTEMQETPEEMAQICSELFERIPL